MIRLNQFIALQTLMRKEIVRVLRIWPQTLVPPIITMTLYFLIFGKFIGERIDPILGNFSFVQFIAPGLIMMAVITNSYGNVVSSFFSAKFQRNIEEILISPMSYALVILGYVFGGVSRGLAIAVLVTLVSLLFADIQIYNLAIIITVVVLTAVLFSLGGLLNAIFAKKFDDINIFPTFVITPLIYLGGVFYSIDSLPEIWQKISLFNPILYMVNAFRYGFLGHSDVNVWYALSFLGLVIIVLFFLCYALLRQGRGLRM